MSASLFEVSASTDDAPVHRSDVAPIATQAVAEQDLRWVVTAMTWMILLLLLVGTSADPDLWGHIRFGLDVISARDLPTVDPYSFTQDRPIIYHEWLGAVLLGLAYSAGGIPAVLLLKSSVLVIAYWIIWRAWREVQPIVAGAFLVLGALGALWIIRTTRPQIWTLLGLLLTMTVLQRELTAPRVAVLVATFIAWANLHGGFILGLVVLAVWCWVQGVQQWRSTGRVPWLCLVTPAVVGLATVATPYGVGLWQFLWDTVGPRPNIVEWWPLWSQRPQEWLPFVVLLVIVTTFRLWPDWPATAVILVLWCGGIGVSRFAYLAVPVTVMLIAPVAAARWPRSNWQWRAPSRAAAWLMLVPLVPTALAVWLSVSTPFECLRIGDQDAPGAARLAATQGEGRLVVWFNWGQYALWHLAPRLKVSVDGRRETLYSEATLETQNAVAKGGRRGDQWLLENKPEYVWLPAALSTRRSWLTANGYRLDHDTDESYIAVRNDLPVLPQAEALGQCVK